MPVHFLSLWYDYSTEKHEINTVSWNKYEACLVAMTQHSHKHGFIVGIDAHKSDSGLCCAPNNAQDFQNKFRKTPCV